MKTEGGAEDRKSGNNSLSIELKEEIQVVFRKFIDLLMSRILNDNNNNNNNNKLPHWRKGQRVRLLNVKSRTGIPPLPQF